MSFDERLPPQDLAAEQSVLGSLLIDAAAWDKVNQLAPADFYSEKHRRIYTACQSLKRKKQPIDVRMVESELKATVAGDDYGLTVLFDLVNATPTTANVEGYARIVKEMAVRRSAQDAARQLVDECYRTPDITTTLAAHEKRIFSIGHVKAKAKTGHDLINLHMDRFDARMRSDGPVVLGIDTDWHMVNRLLYGICPGRYILIAARPSMGKTALLWNLVVQMLRRSKRGVVFSGEETDEFAIDKLVCIAAGVDHRRFIHGKVTEEEQERLTEAWGLFSTDHLIWFDDPDLPVEEFAQAVRRGHHEQPLDYIAVDYLQLMRLAERTDSEYQRVTKISRVLANLAHSTKIPLIALSQLSRRVEDRADKRPVLADLRESGALEQDADIVGFIYRDHYYDPKAPPNRAELIFPKHRGGELGTANLIWDAPTQRFMCPYSTGRPFNPKQNLFKPGPATPPWFSPGL